jgi:hypothetical protein
MSFLSCEKEEKTGQLLDDPSLNFSNGKTFPSSWFYNPLQSRHQPSWSAKQSGSNDYHFAISSEVSDADNISFFGQTVVSPIPKGKKLMLRARIKAENLTGQGASIAIRCDGPNGSVAGASTEDKTVLNGTFDWKEVSLVLDKVLDETNAIWVFLVYLPYTTGKVSFDDITLSYNK